MSEAFKQPQWESEAACRQHPTAWWFRSDEPESVEAFLICQECPVATECLEFALDHPALVGIWAATSTHDRVRLRRQRRRRSGTATT
jgi:WhiB family redox-sensing transcriptional regulator